MWIKGVYFCVCSWLKCFTPGLLLVFDHYEKFKRDTYFLGTVFFLPFSVMILKDDLVSLNFNPSVAPCSFSSIRES